MTALKPATPADWDDIRAMGRQFHAEDGHALSDKGEAALQSALAPSPYVRTWLVTEQGQVAGYGVLCFSYSIEFGGLTSYLDNLYVKPEFRGHGTGTRALQLFEDISRAEGCCIFHLEVEAGNARAFEFYRRHGLRDTQRRLLIKQL